MNEGAVLAIIAIVLACISLALNAVARYAFWRSRQQAAIARRLKRYVG